MAIPIWLARLKPAEQNAVRQAERVIDRTLGREWGPSSRTHTTPIIQISVYDLLRQDIDLQPRHLDALKAAYEHVGWFVEISGNFLRFSKPA